MKILIIGGTGTISGGIAKEAIKRGYEVTLLNRGRSEFRCPCGAAVIHCDVNDGDKFVKALSGDFYDVVVDPITYNKVALLQRVKLLTGHCGTYVFISSTAAIGNKEGVQDEGSDKNPKWEYGVNKLECEEYLQSTALPFKYIIIRPSITYGDIRIPIPVSCRKNPYTVIDRIKNCRPLVCFNYTGANSSLHKLMDIRDFSKYAVELFGKEYAANNDYIICSDKAYSWEEAYDALYEKLDASKQIYEIDGKVFSYLKPSLYDDYLYDKGTNQSLFCKDKIKRDSGIVFDEIPLRKGISDLVDYLEKYYKSQPLEDDYDLMTDAALMFAVKNKDVSLKRYLRSLDSQYLKRVKRYYYAQKVKASLIYRMLRKIKRIIK